VPKSGLRVLDVLEYLAGPPVADGVTGGAGAGPGAGATHAGIAEALGIPKSSLTGLLGDLAGRGYVRFDPASRRYILGSRVLSLGRRYLEALDLPRIAEPVLDSIVKQVNESSALAIRDGSEIVVIAQATCGHQLVYTMTVGHRAPLHCTASGKIILAFEADREALLAGMDLARVTGKTITDRAVLRRHLRDARSSGYAVSDEEAIDGVFALAVPIFAGRRVAAALSTAIPSSRLTGGLARRVLRVLADGADELNAHLGGSGAQRAGPRAQPQVQAQDLEEDR